MGRKKSNDLQYIEDPQQRNITYCKRRIGILKKAMELSQLCGQKIFFAMYDQKDKLILYRSQHDFDEDEVKKLS